MATLSEGFPAFFDEAPVIWMRDPLAQFLGAANDGLLQYHYVDVVRLAGHSCPTVASAYLMTRAALRKLYGEEIPERGGLTVQVNQPAGEGVAGVMGSVVTLITGATVETGFKGIGGQFSRRNLLAYDAPIDGELRFTRRSNGQSVTVSAHPQRVPGDPQMRELLPLCIEGTASREQAEQFGKLWQERVRRLLLEYADDPEIIVLH